MVYLITRIVSMEIVCYSVESTFYRDFMVNVVLKYIV